MKSLMVISHYTLNTGYEREVIHLIDSLDRLDLPRWIVPISSLGSWRNNSNWCAKQVRQALEAYPDHNILRVDADAVFHKRPDLLSDDDFTADIAAHVHTWGRTRRELLGGTMFFRNTEHVRLLVDVWAYQACKIRASERNGDLLYDLVKRNSNIKFVELPDTYCKIFDLMKDVKDPVIEHFQASRRFKRQVNAKGRQ